VNDYHLFHEFDLSHVYLHLDLDNIANGYITKIDKWYLLESMKLNEINIVVNISFKVHFAKMALIIGDTWSFDDCHWKSWFYIDWYLFLFGVAVIVSKEAFELIESEGSKETSSRYSIVPMSPWQKEIWNSKCYYIFRLGMKRPIIDVTINDLSLLQHYLYQRTLFIKMLSLFQIYLYSSTIFIQALSLFKH
jgi:hypothetical protein